MPRSKAKKPGRGQIQAEYERKQAGDLAVAQGDEAETQMIDLARIDVETFIEYVLRDEKSGKPIENRPMHSEWQALLDKYPRLVVWSHVEGGKTNQVSVGRVLWEIGKNSDLRVVIVSNTNELAKKIIALISAYIERSEELHRVFPRLKKSEPWNTTMITVQRTTFAKDPTVEATSMNGHIAGSRIDLLIFDDALDYDNTRTEEMRKASILWVDATLMNRLTDGARVWNLGNAWHREDWMHEMKKRGAHSVSYPVVDAEGNSTWPERWPKERLDQAKVDTTSIEFARKWLCVVRDDAESRFKKADIDRCLARGRGKQLMHALRSVPFGCRIFTGVDLGVGRKKKSDSTVLFTVCIHPDQSREVLCIEAGKWSGDEIIQRIIATHWRWHSIIFVENNQAQDFIVQFTQLHSSVPVYPFTTTGEKKHNLEFGLESMSAEMSAGKWIIPCDEALKPVGEVMMWVNEMLYYSPTAHTGDRLMASWIAREGSRVGVNAPKAERGRLDLLSR